MIASLDDAWNWCQTTKKSIVAMQRIGRKHWERLFAQSLELRRDDKLNRLDPAEIVAETKRVLDEWDDLSVLFLFTVFEATVRSQVLAEVEASLPDSLHPVLDHAVGEARQSVESGSFYRVVDPYKARDPDLVEEVNQVRRYRNWVAHGRRNAQPAAVAPAIAFDRLKRFLSLIASQDG